MDPTGAVVPGVILRLTRLGGGESRSATSDETGEFAFLLLPPGSYELQAAKAGFDTVIDTEIIVSVTETTRLVVQLRVTTVVHRIQVSTNPGMIQTDTSALGRVVDEREVTGLPLVTRNFSQIASLSPGVETGVYNAGEFGLGGTAQSQIASSNDGIFVHGARSYDNNYQLDGI
ncbi:MAG TPA: carboxypeptidase-like regulatory domain-containing protein, partial [Anaerolineales bacterium]|nr:carboxypeptidase-like regulatory domain-containing protein [Anaerolineales bacterium]